MKAATAIGIAVAACALLLGAMMTGTTPTAFLDIPAFLIIFGGTAGVTMASVGIQGMKRIPALYKLAFSSEPPDMRARLDLLVSLADKARREGLLALDGTLKDIDDSFTRNALQLVVDGADPEMVHAVTEVEIERMEARHAAGAMPFDKAGGFAPTMGIIGTVMGLIHVLANLSSPKTLGPSIATAFLATLLGVGSANVVYLPLANRLKAISAEEVELRMMTLEGILSIQSGDNPRLVADKLKSYLPPAEREAEATSRGKAAAPAASVQPEAA